MFSYCELNRVLATCSLLIVQPVVPYSVLHKTNANPWQDLFFCLSSPSLQKLTEHLHIPVSQFLIFHVPVTVVTFNEPIHHFLKINIQRHQPPPFPFLFHRVPVCLPNLFSASQRLNQVSLSWADLRETTRIISLGPSGTYQLQTIPLFISYHCRLFNYTILILKENPVFCIR